MKPDGEPIAIDIDRTAEYLRIRPHGDINLASSPTLRQTLHAALSEGDERVDIMLSDVPYMDSSGVATLVEALQQCRRQDRDLRL
ncbi:MAG TPA: STAS domain-containing protein, partial [Phycisphaerales bacterium]|nr:STAS domain-containing protein [Phycisphaerales bacterium]